MHDAKAYAWLGSVDLSDNSDWTGVRLVRSSSVATVSSQIPSPLGPSPTINLKVSAACVLALHRYEPVDVLRGPAMATPHWSVPSKCEPVRADASHGLSELIRLVGRAAAALRSVIS